MKKDYYEILGISDAEKKLDKDAFAKKLKQNFRKLSIQFHPDKQVGKNETDKKIAEDKFKEVAEAYSVLSDENKRKQYDNYGFNSVPNGGGFDFGGFDIGDLFGKYSDMFDLNDLFGGGGNFYWSSGNFGQQNQSKRNYTTTKQGSDLRITLKLTLKEIVDGCEKKIKYKRFVKCDTCDGTGSADQIEDTCPKCGGTGKQVKTQSTPFGFQQFITTCPECNGTGHVIRNKCKKCNGTGVVEKEEIISIKIPAGSIKNSMITSHGNGNYPKNCKSANGSYGNLIVIIDEIPNDQFTHDGRNIYYNALLDIPTAVLGGDIFVPLYDGSQKKVHINGGVQPGSRIVLQKEGLPINGSMYNVGDYIIQISVYMPEVLTKNEIKLFEELRKSENVKKK